MSWVVLSALNALGSLAVPFLLAHFVTLTLFQDWVIAGLIFIGLNGFEVLATVKEQLAIRRQEQRGWTERDDLDDLLTSIRTDYRNMMVVSSKEDSGLLRHLIWKRIEKVRDDIHVAAETKELYVRENHAVDTRKVTDLFRTKRATSFWEIFKIDNSSAIFDVYSGAYFQQIYDLVKSGHILEVKALVVVDSKSDNCPKKAAELLSFYEVTPGYSARAVASDNYEKLHEDSGLEQFEDFGIYGDVLLFRTLGYSPSRGKYSYDSLKISKHKEFFEACWSAPGSPDLPKVQSPLTIDMVLKL